MLTQTFPNYKTVHRQFQHWFRQEILKNVLCSLANELREFDPHKTYIDAASSRGAKCLGIGRCWQVESFFSALKHHPELTNRAQHHPRSHLEDPRLLHLPLGDLPELF